MIEAHFYLVLHPGQCFPVHVRLLEAVQGQLGERRRAFADALVDQGVAQTAILEDVTYLRGG